MKDPDQWSHDGDYNPGHYKTFENYAQRSTGKIHAYLLPNQVAEAMEELIRKTNESLKNIDVSDINKHPITIATNFHQQFLNKIHPFSDGNGRIARMMVNLILLKSGYAPIFIKEVNRLDYLKRFEISDYDISPMLDFMADRLIESLEEKFQFMVSRKMT